MSEDLAAIGQAVINEGQYMAVATADQTGQPWCSPVFYAVTRDLDFIFISSIESRHATNIRNSGRASWAVYWGDKSPETTDGVMMAGTAQELAGEEETQHWGDILYDQRFPDTEERRAHPVVPKAFWDSKRRIYVLHAEEAYKVDRSDPHGVSRIAIHIASLAAGIDHPVGKVT